VRNRIKELRMVPASQLTANPRNWRTHPDGQRAAVGELIDEVGFADAVIARELPDGSLMLIDGHLRAETAGVEVVPVLVLDVTDAEADKLLLTLDPLAAMAVGDAERLGELLKTTQTENDALQELMDSTAQSAGLFSALGADDGETADFGPPARVEKVQSASRDDNEPRAVHVVPNSGVRMVQLFLDESNIGEFHACCSALSAAYEKDNLTDTVLEAVRRANASL